VLGKGGVGLCDGNLDSGSFWDGGCVGLGEGGVGRVLGGGSWGWREEEIFEVD